MIVSRWIILLTILGMKDRTWIYGPDEAEYGLSLQDVVYIPGNETDWLRLFLEEKEKVKLL